MNRQKKQDRPQVTLNKYVNTGCIEVFDKMQEIRRRRGYSKDLAVWEILVDLDRKLTDAEEALEKMSRLP